MEVTLGSNLGNSFTIKNSTYKETFTGGRDELVLNRKFGSWFKVMVILETNKQRTTADVLVEVKGPARNLQIKCYGVKAGKNSKIPIVTESEIKDSTKYHGRFKGLLFASGFCAACFAIGLTGACVVMRKRKSSHKSSALTYRKSSGKTGTGDDSQRSANEIMRSGPSRQDAGAGESDKKDEDAEHLYSFPVRPSSDRPVSAHRGSAISEKGSLHVECEESSSCQQHKAESAYDLESYPKAPPRTKGKRKCTKVPGESSDKSLERCGPVVLDVDKVVVVEL